MTPYERLVNDWRAEADDLNEVESESAGVREKTLRECATGLAKAQTLADEKAVATTTFLLMRDHATMLETLTACQKRCTELREENLWLKDVNRDTQVIYDENLRLKTHSRSDAGPMAAARTAWWERFRGTWIPSPARDPVGYMEQLALLAYQAGWNRDGERGA